MKRYKRKFKESEPLKEYTNFRIDYNQFHNEIFKYKPRYLTVLNIDDDSRVDYSGSIAVNPQGDKLSFQSNSFSYDTPSRRDILEINKKIGKHIGCVDYAIHYKKGTTCLLSGISAF